MNARIKFTLLKYYCVIYYLTEREGLSSRQYCQNKRCRTSDWAVAGHEEPDRCCTCATSHSSHCGYVAGTFDHEVDRHRLYGTGNMPVWVCLYGVLIIVHI